MGEENENKVEFELKAEQELRFEVEADSKVSMEITEGKVEMFGTELTKGHPYTFDSRTSVGVFTWHGSKITLTGKTELAYVAKETPMTLYLNIHTALEQLRNKAEQDGSRGPRVMIAGPTDVGKSTLCRLLVNYAVRSERSIVLTDLDVGQTELSLPGTLAAVNMERPIDAEEGFAHASPLAFHFGHKSPNSNIPLYTYLVSRMAEIINIRAESNRRASVGGVIINTCGWVRDAGYRCLLHAAGAFEVDVVLVLDQERLYSQLTKDVPSFVRVVLLPKSGGVVERSQKTRMTRRDRSIHDYFYGSTNNLYPHTFDVKFADIKVFRIGAPVLPDSMLPLGMSCEDSRTKLVPLQPSGSFKHHVFSVSAATSAEEDLVNSPVLGFLLVTEVDMEKQTMVVLSPAPRPLPSSCLLMMDDVQYIDVK